MRGIREGSGVSGRGESSGMGKGYQGRGIRGGDGVSGREKGYQGVNSFSVRIKDASARIGWGGVRETDAACHFNGVG